MKKSIFLFFAAILCAMSLQGANGTTTVYFKNTVNWGKVYVYFYKGEYWSDSNGSGSSTGGNCVSGPKEMTFDEKLGLYKYTYTGTYTQYISFTKDKQDNYGNFWQTEAVYRTDYNANTPVYVPSTTSSGTKNSNVKYYNNGSWEPLLSEGTITVYFNNTVNWSDVYVYFYKGEYWSASNGSGSSTGGNCISGPNKMTYDSNLKLYKYTYTGKYCQNISFTKDEQSNYGNFWQTEAVYRTDFNSAKPVYTPKTTSSGTLNQNVKYYNTGSWDVLKYSVTIKNDGNGTTDPSGEQSNVTEADGLVIKATASDNYEFVNWTITTGTGSFDNENAASTTFYPTSNATIQANFRSTLTYSLTVQGGTNITSVTGSTDPVTLGESYAITATPVDGYEFDTWTAYPAANASFDNAANASTNVTVQNGSVTVTASATEIMSTLTTVSGTPSIAPPTADVSEIGIATTATVTAATGAGYILAGWTLENCVRTDGGADNATTITVKSNGDGAAATLTANYNKAEAVYFINNNGWSKIQVHAWGGTAAGTDWPGIEITDNKEGQINGYDVYSFTAEPGAYTNIIFNSKEGESGEQTNDFVWTDGKYYYMYAEPSFEGESDTEAEEALKGPGFVAMHGNFTGGWKDSKNFVVATDKKTASLTMTIAEGSYEFGVKINGSWTSNGSAFTRENNEYAIGSGSGNLTLTADMSGEYTFTWTYETNTLEIVFPEEEVVVSHTYTVVGSSPELFTNVWSPAETANNMEKQTDGSYVKVYNNIELTSDVEWKIAKDGTWWNETPLENKATNGNSVLTISKSGIYNVTFTLSADLKTAHAEAELLEETNTVADCYISGNATLTGGEGWKGNEFKMEDYDSATKTYSYTLTGLVTDKAYELKVVLGGAWYGFDELVAPAPANVSEGTDNSIAFKMAAAGDVVVTYNKDNGINLTGNFAVPTPATYTVVGHKDILGESWNLASTINIMTETDGNYTLTKTGLKLEARDYEYKVVKNGAYGEGEYPNGTNEKVTITENGVYTIVYTYKVGTSLEAVATKTGDYTPDKATYTVAGDIALCGTNWKADDETNDMTDNGDGTFTWAKTGIELVTNVSFKVVKNHDFEIASYPSNNWVIDIEGSNGVYNITITFTESNQEIKVEKTRTGDLPEKTLVYTVTVPAGTKQCYIAGDMNGWTAQSMTPAGTNKFSISIDNVTIATGYKYTCKDGDDTWAYVEKKNGNGEVVNRTYNANDIVERWNRIDVAEGENAAIIGSHKGKGVVEVQVNRQFEADKLYTLSLPFTMSGKTNIENIFGEGTIVYEFSKLEKDDEDLVLYFNDAITTIEAGKPYLIQPGQAVDGFRYENVDVDDTNKSVTNSVDGTTITMESVLSVAANAMTNGKYWLASDNILYRTNTSLLSLRAVFDIQSTKANIRARVAFGENVETGFDNIITTDAPVKVIQNGQLIIIRDGVKYNVQGQKL